MNRSTRAGIATFFAAILSITSTTAAATAEPTNEMSMVMEDGKCPWVTQAQGKGFLGASILKEGVYHQAPRFGCVFATEKKVGMGIVLQRLTMPTAKIAMIRSMTASKYMKEHNTAGTTTLTGPGMLMAIRGTTLVTVVMAPGGSGEHPDGIEFMPLAGLMFKIKNYIAEAHQCKKPAEFAFERALYFNLALSYSRGTLRSDYHRRWRS